MTIHHVRLDPSRSTRILVMMALGCASWALVIGAVQIVQAVLS